MVAIAATGAGRAPSFWSEIAIDLNLVTIRQGVQRDWLRGDYDLATEIVTAVFPSYWTLIYTAIKTFWDDEIKWRLEEFAKWMKEDVPEAAKKIWDKVVEAFEGIKTGVQAPFDFLKSVFDRIEGFYNWLKDKVFSFTIKLPKIPDWAKPGSPIPLHTAWKNFATDMKRMEVQFPAAPTGSRGGMPAMAAAGGAGGGDINLYITGVLDDRMVDKIGNMLDRRKRMRGGGRRF